MSLSLCFVICKYEWIPIFQGHGDGVIESMEKYLAQGRQSISVSMSSFQFSPKPACYRLPSADNLTLITHSQGPGMTRSINFLPYAWPCAKHCLLSPKVEPLMHRWRHRGSETSHDDHLPKAPQLGVVELEFKPRCGRRSNQCYALCFSERGTFGDHSVE